MNQETSKTLIIAVAIVLAAVFHALIVRDTGRYQAGSGSDLIDSRTGETFAYMGSGEYIPRPLKVRKPPPSASGIRQ